MDRMIHTAATALRGNMARQGAIAHNLANASTPGYRADVASADAHYLAFSGYVSRVQSAEALTGYDAQAGAVVATGRNLDIAIGGSALLAVQATNGEEAYTRRGDLSVAPSGMLQTGDGLLVLGDEGPMSIPPADALRIADDGTVWIVPAGGNADAEQAVGRLKLSSSDGAELVKGRDGLLRVQGGGVLPPDVAARVQSGALEQSNVNATAALVDMLTAARGYEVQVKLLSTAEAMDQAGTRLMTLNG